MALPTTGTDWNTGGFNQLSTPSFIRGGRQAALIRQARGSLTDMSPAVFSPFAQDGKLRADLFAEVTQGGFYVTNPDDNEGFYHLGPFKEGNGPSEDRKLDKDEFMVEQLNQAYDVDIIKESMTVKVTPVETLRPIVAALRHGLGIYDDEGNNILVDRGQLNVSWMTPSDTDFIDWQLLLLHARRVEGQDLVVATGYPLCKLVDKGTSKMDKKDSRASEFGFEPLPDGFLVDLNGRPGVDVEWVSGAGWTAQGGIPIVSLTPPVATLGATGKASFVFADPTGTGDPFTITAQSTVDDGTTWITATLDTPGAVVSASGSTTVKVKSVAAGSTKFRAVVTGTNGAIAYTPKSNAVTIT